MAQCVLRYARYSELPEIAHVMAKAFWDDNLFGDLFRMPVQLLRRYIGKELAQARRPPKAFAGGDFLNGCPPLAAFQSGRGVELGSGGC